MAEGSLMPDIGFAECSFDEQAYSIDNNVGALKVRNFLYSPNNYEAILFINNLIMKTEPTAETTVVETTAPEEYGEDDSFEEEETEQA